MPGPKTTGLLLETIASGDNNKYLLVNDGLNGLDQALTKRLNIDYTSVSTYSLSEAEFTRNQFFVAQNNSVSVDLVVPATVNSNTTSRMIVVRNSGTAAVTVGHSTGDTVDVSAGDSAVIYLDGTNAYQMAGSGGSGSGVTVSSGSISGGDILNTSLTATGRHKISIRFVGVTSDTDDVQIRLTTYHNSVEETGSNYRSVARRVSSSGADTTVGGPTQTYFPLHFAASAGWGLGNAAGETAEGVIDIYFPENDSNNSVVEWRLSIDGAGGNPVLAYGTGVVANTANITGFRLNLSTGNITAGVCTIVESSS